LSGKEWLKDYRALQVLEAQVNSCMGGFTVPFNLFSLTCVVVTYTTLVVRIHLGLFLSSVCFVVACTNFIIVFLVTYLASNIAASSEKAIALQRKRCKVRSEFQVLLACKPLGLQSGSFRILDRDAMLTLMMANVDYTVSALLAF
jgi:hypothetical protein